MCAKTLRYTLSIIYCFNMYLLDAKDNAPKKLKHESVDGQKSANTTWF